ncbi:MAG: MtrB/PioB family outer membrane beta-barrel protein [Burkholderiales bacterium]|nr:MtrB/PioB family outer membrane beta-barrel protein [Burkholderiales bacterium]
MSHRTPGHPGAKPPAWRALGRLLGWAAVAGLAAPAALADPLAAWPGTLGDAAHPALRLGPGERDPAGLGPYRTPASRSPAGLLYALPFTPPREARLGDSGWWVAGFAEAGLLLGETGRRPALSSQYRDTDNGLVLQRFDLQANKPDEARFMALVGGAAGHQDQHIGLQFGRYNDYRVSLAFNATPQVSATGARPIWQGVGTGQLVLTPAPGVAAGGASANNAANAAALQRLIAHSGDTTLGVQRRSGAARIELRLAEGWTLLSSVALDLRQGARAFGGNEGNGETVEPIDQRTHTLRAELQYADERTQLNLALAASLFRNHIDTLSWENPFRHPVGALRILGGRADLAPDNEAYHARLEFAQSLLADWRGRLTATLELGALRQNDTLIPPTATRGTGAPFGSGFDGNFDLWNTGAALSRPRAEAAIDTRLLDLGLSLAPAPRLTVRATLRHHASRNGSQYTAFNPQTGQYGYIIQDTNARTVYDGSNNIHYRSIPFEGAQDTLRLGTELQLRRRAMLSAEAERDTVHRAHRERHRTWEDRLRLGYTERGFERMTLRLSYEQARRRGSPYESDPYRAFYTVSRPDYTVTRANLLDALHTLEEQRKFDLADRRQQLLKARINLMPRDDMDLGLTLQARADDYPAEFGRTGRQSQHAVHLDAGYLPSAATALTAYLSRQRARQQQAGAADLGSAVAAGCFSLPPSCSNAFGAPGSIYPARLAWRAAGQERSSAFGIGLRHRFGRPELELQYSRVSSRSPLAYAYASADALQSPGFAAQAADSFTDMRHQWQAVDAALRLPLSRSLALRLTLRHERVRVADWHYSGLDQGLVVGNRVYLDAGPEGYRALRAGAFVQLSL